MTKHTALLMYTSLGLTLAFQVLTGVWQSGSALAANQKVAERYQHKTELLAERQVLENKLAHQHSLLNIVESPVYKEFQPITQVATIKVQTTVASR